MHQNSAQKHSFYFRSIVANAPGLFKSFGLSMGLLPLWSGHRLLLLAHGLSLSLPFPSPGVICLTLQDTLVLRLVVHCQQVLPHGVLHSGQLNGY
jgi:hypothetical protein